MRVDWVDHAKGLCIIFVVMMHSTLGVEADAGQTGWMHAFVQFAKPFRMPDFFLISGLFLGVVIARPWRRYVDRKVVHFAYFYCLWITIQFALKAPLWIGEGMSVWQIAANYGLAFVQPFGTLWFIYLLPVFFIVTRLLAPLPAIVLLGCAAFLEILPVNTGWVVADEFASRFVYFLAGYMLASNIFAIASWARGHMAISIAALAGWLLINLWATFTPVPHFVADSIGAGGFEFVADLPVISLLLGAAGALAIVVLTALLSLVPWMRFLGYVGRNSIVIYLAFFFPMVVSRILLLKFAPTMDVGTVSVIVTFSGVIGPLLAHAFILWSGIGRFLFERPQWARLERGSTLPAVAAQFDAAE